MARKTYIKHVSFGRAEKFLDALSPRSRYFEDTPAPGHWVFRGHSDERWPLLPSAFRRGALLKRWLVWETVGGKRWTNRKQVEAELHVVRRFFWLADVSGLPIPEDSQETRTLLQEFEGWKNDEKEREEKYRRWPPVKLLSLIALAQHHGLPTRLLDWSGSAYKAAYFAALDAARWQKNFKKRPEGAESLGVWALDKFIINIGNPETRASPLRSFVSLVTAPGAANVNLYAQEGVFTLSRPPEFKLDGPVDLTPFDQAVEERLAAWAEAGPLLVHFRLPIEEAPRLLRLLALEGISGATLFPGFDGVVRGLNEERLWD